MKPVVAIVAQGSMGSGLARVLTSHGLQVLTALAGRSAASAARAAAAGMETVSASELARADILLSILPPAQAVPFATNLAPLLSSSAHKPLFVDCNAVNPRTIGIIANTLAPTGVSFVDVGIIGLPPTPDSPGPHLYAAGPGASQLTVLNDYGLDVRVIQGPPGAASALKMSYAGITKGTLAVVSAMILGASRAGVSAELARELAESDPRLIETLARRIPDMLPKAYRWVEEMRQIAGFVAPDESATALYQGAAGLFAHIAADADSSRIESSVLRGFFER